jgi:hypothetical protein
MTHQSAGKRTGSTMNNLSQNTECCPEFDPKKWDQKTFHWDNKPFIKETIPTFFHIPFPPMIGRKIVRMWKMAEDAEKTEADKGNVLVLFRDPNAFKSEIYLSVTDSVQGANNVSVSGIFFGKVFSGPYNAVPKHMREMNEYLSSQGKKAKDYYVHFAYCPKCAEKYGNNYMILFAQIQ